eukprot:CAMPEP_0119472532 /NCGR_PEP_ID=MMETSP1344-20130328/4556_1 /TAXON_ID=236787 /ORGANISM="Florenciella parvula, Strain CCMP2471" /LENGTH=129 /DNA_ID=CAMNT_0007505497 /DNA_START=82 /DNA_END=467 /DNA_ORIENTATION=+
MATTRALVRTALLLSAAASSEAFVNPARPPCTAPQADMRIKSEDQQNRARCLVRARALPFDDVVRASALLPWEAEEQAVEQALEDERAEAAAAPSGDIIDSVDQAVEGVRRAVSMDVGTVRQQGVSAGA